MTRLPEDPLDRYTLFRSDPWAFLTHCVFTHDEVDAERPIKPYPVHLDYLRFLVAMWMKRKKLAIPKSRRLTVSWTFIALALWDCIFHKGRSWALVSKKEEDSKELIQRAKFIYDHIPPEMIPPDLLPKLKRGEMQTSPPVMEFPDIYSKLMGFPSGGNQMRQRGFSGLLFDEVAFWEEAEAAFASSEPTIKGGGRMVMVSTRYPGFFKKIVYDRLDSKDINFPDIPPVIPSAPMEGIDVWENPGNGFTIIDLSHRANPAKRTEIFERELRRSLPKHLFDMEYGKSWSNFEGKAVYEDFDPSLHITHSAPQVEAGLPLLIGWDSSGLTPAVVLAQLQGEQLVCFKEIIGIGEGAVRFVPRVASWINFNLPQITSLDEHTVSFIDPAGLKKSETNEQTYMQYIIKGGFRQVRPGPMTWERRREAVIERLVGLANRKAKLIIYEQDCPLLAAGMKGGYRYPDKLIEVEPDKVRPIKDIHSHCFPAGTLVETPDGFTPIECLSLGDEVITPWGSFPVTAVMNRDTDNLLYIETEESSLVCTPDHPIWDGKRFVRADALQYDSDLCLSKNIPSKNSTDSGFTGSLADTSKQTISEADTTCIATSGVKPTEKFRRGWISTIKTAIKRITDWRTWSLLSGGSTVDTIAQRELTPISRLLAGIWTGFVKQRRFGTDLQKAENGIKSTPREWLQHFLSTHTHAFSVGNPIRLNAGDVNVAFAPPLVRRMLASYRESTTKDDTAFTAEHFSRLTSTLRKGSVLSLARIKTDTVKVYDITVDQAHCFYANGILVSNCNDALQYLCGGLKSYRSEHYNVEIPTPSYGFQKESLEPKRKVEAWRR